MSGTVAARNLKFGMHIDHKWHLRTKCKIRSKGIMWGHATHFCNFGTTLISQKRLKLETSNLARATEIDDNKY